MLEKARAASAIAKAVLGAKECATGLLEDANALKDDLSDLKNLASKMAEDLKEPEAYLLRMKNIGMECKDKGFTAIKACYEHAYGPIDKGGDDDKEKAGDENSKGEVKAGDGGSKSGGGLLYCLACKCCGSKKRAAAKMDADAEKARAEAPIPLTRAEGDLEANGAAKAENGQAIAAADAPDGDATAADGAGGAPQEAMMGLGGPSASVGDDDDAAFDDSHFQVKIDGTDKPQI